MGKVLAVCLGGGRETQKLNIKTSGLIDNENLYRKSNGVSNHSILSILSYERIKDCSSKGIEIDFGIYGENLVVEGMDFTHMPIGTRFRCGDVILETTNKKNEDSKAHAVNSRIDNSLPLEEVFVRVVSGGIISVGDEMVKLDSVKDDKIRAAVITLSDKGCRGERIDKSGPVIASVLEEMGYVVEEQLLLSDDRDTLEKELKRLSDIRQLNLIFTTGGTGFSKRDNTPEATLNVAEKNAPGIAEAIRAYYLNMTPKGMLCRGVSVLRGKTLIINLPGSAKAVLEILNYIMPAVDYGIHIADGTQSEYGKYIN